MVYVYYFEIIIYVLKENLGQGACTIRRILCAYNICNDQFDLTWITKLSDDQQSNYPLQKYCVYLNV